MSCARNLNEYDNVMNRVAITNFGRLWVCLIFTISSIINKWHIVLGIVKYWVYRIVYGIENTRVTS